MRPDPTPLVRMIDTLNRRLGRAVSWLAVAMVAVQFALVLLRYVFGVGFIALQEAVVYMHAMLFMLAAAYTLSVDGHVRVDVFYRTASPRRKAAVDLCGVVFFLWPFCWAIWDKGYPYVANSWRVLERSTETAGLPGVFLLKTVILVLPVLVALQGMAIVLKAALTLARPTATEAGRR